MKHKLIDSLAEIIGDTFQFPKPLFRDIEECLNYLFKKSEETPIVLVFDEYPYLRENVKGLDSIIQSVIDRYKDTSHMKFILCGSYVDTMKGLLAKQNPLYGRIDLTIDLKPMDYYEASLFYEGFSNEDKVRLYSVFGGIPYYKDILDQSNVSSGPTLVDILDKLIKMDVVKRETPINDENNKKRAGYFISDNLSLFYYKYIFRNISRMSIMDPEVFYNKYIDEDFETKYVPKIFEDICRQYLIRCNKAGMMEEAFYKIGKYYYDDPINKQNGEFDIVTLDDKGYIFYDAKFRKGLVTESMVKQEILQIEQTGFFLKIPLKIYAKLPINIVRQENLFQRRRSKYACFSVFKRTTVV